MAAPYFRYFILINDNPDLTVYPVIWDQSGTKVLWDSSSDPNNEVGKKDKKPFDLNIKEEIPNDTVVVLGCRIKEGSFFKDTKNTRTYINTSPSAAVGRFDKDQNFVVEPVQPAGLDPAAFQAAYLKLNNPAVARLLHTIANLISPDSPEIAAVA